MRTGPLAEARNEPPAYRHVSYRGTPSCSYTFLLCCTEDHLAPSRELSRVCFCYMLRPSLRTASLLVNTQRSLLQQQALKIPFSHWRMDPAREQQAKDGEGVKGSRPISENIIPRLLNLYNCTATAKDFEIYAPNATFEDPLMRAHGVKQIKSAFYALPKLFSESKIVEYSIQENPTGPEDGEVVIDNKQHYKMMGRDIDLASLIKLQIKDGKVVRHEDWWDKKPLKNRETVKLPLVGRLVEITRRASMLATHAMMGCGKDPRPRNE
ncbi:hypothetical protein Taro_055118 [Colocasia esculenta]|uniref:Uncharacterized protein n=1 Tax=Colocasia esculenta TaxID=4460 RepID=A0A843XSN6_COLES|nr:hypothetical protein [Colocasia esculenta]